MTGKLHLLMIILVSICKLTPSNVLCLCLLSYVLGYGSFTGSDIPESCTCTLKNKYKQVEKNLQIEIFIFETSLGILCSVASQVHLSCFFFICFY